MDARFHARSKRLLELALKGLEAERQRIDEEIADIQEQIGGGGQRSQQSDCASSADGKPTNSRRSKEIVGPDEEKMGREEESDEKRSRSRG